MRVKIFQQSICIPQIHLDVLISLLRILNYLHVILTQCINKSLFLLSITIIEYTNFKRWRMLKVLKIFDSLIMLIFFELVRSLITKDKQVLRQFNLLFITFPFDQVQNSIAFMVDFNNDFFINNFFHFI